jgi:uncharacterized protein (TIRG00374 family)
MLRRYFKILLIVFLTLGLTAFFLRNAQLDRVWNAVRLARVDMLLACAVVTMFSYVLRIERWRGLLRPLGFVSFLTAGSATVIGFAANALLPGRVGEVLRPFVVARHNEISGSAALATVVVERLLDLVAIMVMLAGCIAFFSRPTNNPEWLLTLQLGAVTGGSVGLAVLAGMFWLARSQGRNERLIKWFRSVSPSRWGPVVDRLARRFTRGLTVTGQVGPLAVAFLMSALLWASTALSIVFGSWAFGIDISFDESIILMGMVAIGVSLPTPAGVGGYHAAYQIGATSLYGVDLDVAIGAALVIHAIAFAPVTLLGLLCLAKEGLRLGSLSGIAVGEEPTEPSTNHDENGGVS